MISVTVKVLGLGLGLGLALGLQNARIYILPALTQTIC